MIEVVMFFQYCLTYHKCQLKTHCYNIQLLLFDRTLGTDVEKDPELEYSRQKMTDKKRQKKLKGKIKKNKNRERD